MRFFLYRQHSFPSSRKLCISLAVLSLFSAFPLSGCGTETAPYKTSEPSPIVEAVVSASPTPIPTPEPTPFVITEQWFDDAIFIGDSLTGAMYSYNLVNGGLGNAAIVYSNGYSCHEAIDKNLCLPYMGKSVPVEEAVKLSGAKKVFLLLAMNDVGQPLDELRLSWQTLTQRIAEENPDVGIYIQSGTPIYDDAGYFSNENMDAYNDMLKEFCLDEDYTYVDISRGLADEDGSLKAEYHLDFVHFNNDGCQVWLDNLMDATAYTPSPTE